ncbi:MAG: glutaredoxin family protein [Minisyncoccales bacterium]
MKKENIFTKYIVIVSIIFLISLFAVTSSISAENLSSEERENKNITVHFFEEKGCPNCANMKEFLEETIKEEYPNVKIIEYNIRESENQKKFHDMFNSLGIKRDNYDLIVPTLFIKDNYFQNFFEEDKELIKKAIQGEDVQKEINKLRGEYNVNLPFFGEVSIGNWAVPVAAFILGSLDGLNVCSIGALVLILMIVLGLGSRKKTFFYGGLFILTAVIIYGSLVFAWTWIFDILASYISYLNIFIGIAASIGGVFFLNKFINFYRFGPACEYSGNKLVVKATNRVKSAFKNEKKGAIFLSISVVLFAAIITLVELPCSVGIPLVYGSMLAGEGLSLIESFFYILLYLFFYMLIELVIFIGAVITKEVWFSESKMITWIYLAGALVLFFLGYYYLIGF